MAKMSDAELARRLAEQQARNQAAHQEANEKYGVLGVDRPLSYKVTENWGTPQQNSYWVVKDLGGGSGGGRGSGGSASSVAAQREAQRQAQIAAQRAQYQSAYNSSASLLQSSLAAQLAAEEDYRKQMVAAQQEAYNKNVASTNAYYDRLYNQSNQNYQSQLASAQQDYDAALAQLQQGYDANTGTVNANTARSLQQAYIQNMMAKRNFGQQMAATGRSGGASETALLGLANQYGNNRGTLETSRNDQLAQLALQLAENQAARQSEYNQRRQGYADTYTQMVNEYQAQQAARLAEYEQAMTNYINNWDMESIARRQALQQNYNNQLLALQQQLAAQLAGLV